MLIDSGSDWNLLSEQDWRKTEALLSQGSVIVYDLIKNPADFAKAYGATSQLKTTLSFHAWIEACNLLKPKVFAKFRVVENGDKSIIGHETGMRMKLLQVGKQIEAVEEVTVKPFPCIPELILDFDIDEGVPATKNAYVSIPAAFKEKANDRLKRMEAENIIEKVTSAPKWISGMSAVPKGKDDFRLVINMMGPNRAILRRFYKMPTLEEIKVKLCGARFFTKLDLTWAFYHVKLGEKSRELTTFLGPSGMFRFVRLVFGVNCAPEAFQQIMEDIVRDIPNVIVYIDDLLLYASSVQALRKTTARVLAALQKSNLTLNNNKCEFEKSELEFLGHSLSATGFNIAEKKIQDVRKFREPRSTAELKSFMGLASFIGSYIENFATITKPLWDTAKAKKFEWSRESHEAFQRVKQAIIECTTTHGFFSNSDSTYLYTDASPVALGAVLVQVNPEGIPRIISFASKLLTEVESRYPQTQKEALAIVWGAEHFWFYLLGRKFVIRTDAEGISFILKRERIGANKMLSRAAGWALRLSQFNFDVEFVKGKNNLADPSSRLLEGRGTVDFEHKPAPGEIMTLAVPEPSDVEFSTESVTIEEVKWHAARCEEMKEIANAIESDIWPRKLAAYKTVKQDLRIIGGVITRMGATLIPRALRQKTLVTTMQRSFLPDGPWDELACDFCGTSDISIGDKVFVSRPTKAKGETNYHPSEFTVVGKVHGTLELLSPLGFLIKRTSTFVKKVPMARDEESMVPAGRLTPPEGAAEEPGKFQDEVGRHARKAGRRKDSEGEPIALRRSTRVKQKPAHLRNYVNLLGWELSQNLTIKH